MDRITSTKPLCALLATGLLLASCQRGTAMPATPDRAADEAAIRAVLDAVATEFNAGRMDQMVAHYQDDVVVSAPGAPDVVGKAAWLQAIATTLPADVALALRFDTTEMEIAGDLAYERGTYAIGLKDQPGVTVAGGRHIHMFRRQADGSWKGWRLMENSADPAGAPQPPPATAAP